MLHVRGNNRSRIMEYDDAKLLDKWEGIYQERQEELIDYIAREADDNVLRRMLQDMLGARRNRDMYRDRGEE
jgi:hypothetical protein